MERRRHFRSLMSLGIVAALVGAVAIAGGALQQPTNVCAQAPQCHYTPMDTGAQELGYASPTGTFMRPQQTATLEFTGPYQGTLILSPGAETAIGPAEEVACGTAGQDVTLEKGSGTLTLYAKNCGTSPAEMQFSVDMVDECRRPALLTKFGVNMNEGQQTQNAQSQSPRQQRCANQPQNGGNGGGNGGGNNGGNGGGNNGGGGNNNGDGGLKYRISGAGHHIGADETATEPGGQEDGSLAIRYLMLDEVGPYHILAWWPTVQGARHFRLLVEPDGTPPPGAGNIPENGWHVPYMESYGGRMHSVVIEGEGAGIWPGGVFRVRVQAVGANGDYGPISQAKRVRTYHSTELGAVTNLSASERTGGQAGYVTVRWHKAPGQDDTLWARQDSVVVHYKKAGESYIPGRTARMNWDANRAKNPFSAGTPRLEHGTEYCFRITPRRTNMPDGDPAEVCYTTKTLEPPPKPTIESVERMGSWLEIKFSPSVTFDSMKVVLTSGDDTMTRIVDEEDRAYGGYHRLGGVPTGRSYCVRIAGFVGEGADKLEGELSDEVCE